MAREGIPVVVVDLPVADGPEERERIGLARPRVEPGLIQSALQRSVDFARYWQEADGEDRLAALPEVAAALLPFAEAVVESAEVAWWSQAFSTDQWLVQWQTSEGETIPQTSISLNARLHER